MHSVHNQEASNVNTEEKKPDSKPLQVMLPLKDCRKAHEYEMNQLRKKHNKFVNKAAIGLLVVMALILGTMGVFYLQLKKGKMEVK